jgi:DNA-directed RNA polymerase beta' subunit
MGHIELAVPFRTSGSTSDASRSVLMLDMRRSQLERVIYYEDYIVRSIGQGPAAPKNAAL